MTDELRMQGEVATPEPSADRGSGVARHVGQVSAATFLSRVLGLLRDQVFAAWFGAGTAADAFNMAFRVPNLVRETHGGKLYDSDFRTRMKGTGPYAELLRRRFETACRRFGLSRGPAPLDTTRFRVPPRAGDQLGLFGP